MMGAGANNRAPELPAGPRTRLAPGQVLANDPSSASFFRILWSTINVAIGKNEAVRQIKVFIRLQFLFMA